MRNQNIVENSTTPSIQRAACNHPLRSFAFCWVPVASSLCCYGNAPCAFRTYNRPRAVLGDATCPLAAACPSTLRARTACSTVHCTIPSSRQLGSALAVNWTGRYPWRARALIHAHVRDYALLIAALFGVRACALTGIWNIPFHIRTPCARTRY